MPLVLPIKLICNTSDEEIFANVRENSKRDNWLRLVDAHDGIAVLCGSGPSLSDHINEIAARKKRGEKIFAMNGAASFLAKYGVIPDYQVILDARKETADLIGPARQHLFASQVHPECFMRVPDAQLWQLQVGIEDEFDFYKRSYCLIGGAASVGNTATCLAYAMGYRNLQIYGYDSSNRDDKGHAFHQPMNDGDPQCVVTFNGKEYTASLTMKLQAEKFQETSRLLREAGCTIEVHGDGLLPDMYRAPQEVLDEAAKYEKMWNLPAYRDMSPGELSAGKFLEIAQPLGTVIDFGCGTGRGALRLCDAGLDVVLVDFAENCRDLAAENLPFVKADLTKPLNVRGDCGYCTDVMEHIPPEQVDRVLKNIMAATPMTFFQISTVPDSMGALIGQSLHLTVRDHKWWRLKLAELGYFVIWQEKTKINSSFLVKRSPRNI